MKSFILALATALPQYSLDQISIAEKISKAMQLPHQLEENMNKLYQRTAISRRYSVLEDIQLPKNQWKFWGKDFPQEIPGMKERNDVYCQEAPKLALDSAKKVLENWKGKPENITHIISVSCTGVMAPGLEFHLQKNLKLNPDVQRIGINLMGCFGAFRALAVASSIVAENPDNRVLIVCTELCSLHMQVSPIVEIAIGNALFSDGSAAIIVGGNPKINEQALYSIEKSKSLSIEDSEDLMTWRASDTGFQMYLDKRVPEILSKNINEFVASILENNISYSDCIWAVHPGGKRIIEVVEKLCNLSKDQTDASWKVLKNYGNMSSATFLFVLEEIFKTNKEKTRPYILGMGFGPGLSCEGILLKEFKK